MKELSPASSALDDRLRLIAESHQRLTGRPLLDRLPQDQAALREILWLAPRVIVAHGTEADPVFFYGNRMALDLFELDFAGFTRLPSRFSAEPLERGERERLLKKVARQGYVDDYRGVRVASSGCRFMIAAATVWNLTDEAGICCGQAATFTDWRYIEEPQDGGSKA